MTNFEKIKAADFDELEKIIDKIERFDLTSVVCGEKCPYKEPCDNCEEGPCLLENSYTWYWLQMEAEE